MNTQKDRFDCSCLHALQLTIIMSIEYKNYIRIFQEIKRTSNLCEFFSDCNVIRFFFSLSLSLTLSIFLFKIFSLNIEK